MHHFSFFVSAFFFCCPRNISVSKGKRSDECIDPTLARTTSARHIGDRITHYLTREAISYAASISASRRTTGWASGARARARAHARIHARRYDLILHLVTAADGAEKYRLLHISYYILVISSAADGAEKYRLLHISCYILVISCAADGAEK